MFPDWPNQKREFVEAMGRAIQDRAHGVAPIVAQVPHIILHEGSSMAMRAEDGSWHPVPMRAHEASWNVGKEELARGGPGVLIDAVATLGTSLGSDMERNLLATIKNAPGTVGMTFHGKSAEELEQELLAGLREMEMDFDEDGKPSILTVMSPDLALLFAEVNTAEFQERAEEIRKEKHNEWLRRESRRRLAD